MSVSVIMIMPFESAVWNSSISPKAGICQRTVMAWYCFIVLLLGISNMWKALLCLSIAYSALIMNFLVTILGTLRAFFAFSNAASPKPAIRAFHKIKDKAPVVEKQEYSRSFHNSRLQKRTSPYLNNVTQSIILLDFAHVQYKLRQPRSRCRCWGMPGVGFDIGESCAGLFPVSQEAKETRELLFFWLDWITSPKKTWRLH